MTVTPTGGSSFHWAWLNVTKLTELKHLFPQLLTTGIESIAIVKYFHDKQKIAMKQSDTCTSMGRLSIPS